MRLRQQKRIFFLLFFLFLSGSLIGQARAATFYGHAPTGVVELSEYRYPVFLFVPKTYKPDRDYPLLVMIAGEGELPDQNIEFWAGLASRRNMIILAPTNLWPSDVPYEVDQWLFQIMKETAQKYRVASNKIYLVGKDEGAHYAGYLGVNYPEYFSAVALLGGAWSGKFEKLMVLQKKPRKQVPFFVALKSEQEDLLSVTETKAYELQKKGYPVYFVKLGPEEDFAAADFKKQVLTWLEEKSGHWNAVVEESKKPWKEKLVIWGENLFNIQ